MRIRDKVEKYAWCRLSIEQLKDELASSLRNGAAVPSKPGGWWHQYVCPRHHTELLYDPDEVNPRSFRCEYGCEWTDDKYRGAWLVFRHQDMARRLLSAAAVYAGTGEESYAKLAVDILVDYAKQYPKYPVHPGAEPWMLKGRAFHQALTEAIWATTILRSLLLLRDEEVSLQPHEADIDHFLDLLEESMKQYRHILIERKKNPENNYTAWLNACLACIYAVRGNRDGMESVIEGKGGMRHHLSIGVRPDQFEFEGSVYYHLFVLRAYMITAEMADRLQFELFELKGEDGQSMRGMLQVLVDLAEESGALPALHDGPYRRIPYAREAAEVFEIGWDRYRNEAYLPLMREAYRQLGGKPQRRGMEAVVFGTGEWSLTGNIRMTRRKSKLLRHSGFAIGRHRGNPLSFMIDYGPHGGSHGHYDKLNVILDHRGGVLSPERGMVPYGSSLRHQWFASTAAHNTVSISGQSQQPHEGHCMKFESGATHTYFWGQSKEAYADCILNRHIWLNQEWLLDWFTVETNEPVEQIDWWFHFLGDMEELTTPESGWKSNPAKHWIKSGFGQVEALASMEAPTERQCNVQIRRIVSNIRPTVTVSCLLSPGAKAYHIRSTGTADDPMRPMQGLLCRQSGVKAEFVTVFRNGTEPVILARDQQCLRIRTNRGNEVGMTLGESGLVVRSVVHE